MNKYKVTRGLTIDGQDYVEGDFVELTEDEAASRLESGSLELVDKTSTSISSDSSKVNSELHPTEEKLEEIKVEAKSDKEDGTPAEAISNEERNFDTGMNIIGVNSPDPTVGEIVPSDMVMPGQVVDPRTGKVLDGGLGLSTPTPNAPEKPKRNPNEAKEEGKGWAGHHTV